MRDHEEDNKPRPVRADTKKRTNAPESAEALPWQHLRKDHERDRHRHVC